jgi:hypothetical protein
MLCGWYVNSHPFSVHVLIVYRKPTNTSFKRRIERSKQKTRNTKKQRERRQPEKLLPRKKVN